MVYGCPIGHLVFLNVPKFAQGGDFTANVIVQCLRLMDRALTNNQIRLRMSEKQKQCFDDSEIARRFAAASSKSTSTQHNESTVTVASRTAAGAAAAASPCPATTIDGNVTT